MESEAVVFFCRGANGCEGGSSNESNWVVPVTPKMAAMKVLVRMPDILYRSRWWQFKYLFIFTPKIGVS